MADWEADSRRLRQNLINVLRDARERALRRDQPSVDDARRWHRGMMTGLRVPDGKYRGRFRGERGLETTRVWIGAREGVGPAGVARPLAAFERTLQRAVAAFDVRYPLRAGQSQRRAVAAGFDRVFLIILDTHVTSLVPAAFRFHFGSGAIRSFATMLTIGLASDSGSAAQGTAQLESVQDHRGNH